MNISKRVTVIPFLSIDEYQAVRKIDDYNFLYLAKSEFKVIQQFLIDQENKPEKTKIIMLRENFEEAKRENDESLTEYLLRVKKTIYRQFIQKDFEHILIVVNAKNFKFFSERISKTYFTKDNDIAVTIASIDFPVMYETMFEIHERDVDTRICPWAIPKKHNGVFHGVKIEMTIIETVSNN